MRRGPRPTWGAKLGGLSRALRYFLHVLSTQSTTDSTSFLLHPFLLERNNLMSSSQVSAAGALPRGQVESASG